ncbi:hypothetical protein VDGD_21234 [Verticillium dahliae]|nr:hypothetical protein VDGD_21234 [Verticillium dahliae]
MPCCSPFPCSCSWLFRLLGDPDGAHAHTGADAHGRVANLLAGPLELVQQGGDLPGAGAAEGVAKGNGAALGVDLVEGDAELLGGPEALRGEGLVDLVNVDVLGRDAGELVGAGDGLVGALAHEQRGHADDGAGDVLAEDGLAEALGGGAAHEEHGGGAVGDLRGVAGVDAAVLGKGGADLAERLGRHAGADAVVLVDRDGARLARLGVLKGHGQGRNLGVEEALGLGLGGLGVGRGGEGVLRGARHVQVARHVFGQHAHGDLAVGGLLVVLEELRELGHGAGAGHGVLAGLTRERGREGERERSQNQTYPYWVLMLSTPAPMPISIMPDLIWLIMSMEACRPEEHWRLRVRTAVVVGKPATRAAARISVAPPPGARTVPTAMSSTRAGSILERSSRAFRAPAMRSAAWVSLKPPLPPFVKGVRSAAVTTTWRERTGSVCDLGDDAGVRRERQRGKTYIVGVLLEKLLLARGADNLAGQLGNSLDGTHGGKTERDVMRMEWVSWDRHGEGKKKEPGKR